MGDNTSRMRKVVELMSNPIFGGGYFWDPKENNQREDNHVEVYDPRKYGREKKGEQLLKIEDQNNKQGEMIKNEVVYLKSNEYEDGDSPLAKEKHKKKRIP